MHGFGLIPVALACAAASLIMGLLGLRWLQERIPQLRLDADGEDGLVIEIVFLCLVTGPLLFVGGLVALTLPAAR